ncbi:Gfo/Idh/MocA family oxidoreductase [Candidatus Poribacteria bacterium]|nr:Gfo/Idh/MocA family oxidoreductase [Candidatus Poribacteria bacterium]MYF56425.1 Gfo/Idh/MocA family oxidoreductase [Candidatus Poribacteria bacterium]MYI94532.1 Gfo/Idh/MocA family oxidoreductase [Candidatus Poribacteria bacterium]
MINTAVIGYGYAGRAFHSYLIGLEAGLNLYAIATRNEERREAAREAYPNAKIYQTIDEVIADDAIDLVVLATPHDTHAELAIAAMDTGKHLVTDKIMAMNVTEADAMIAASERNDVMLSVFHNRRWDWDYLTVKKVIEDGLLGIPYLFQVAIMRYGAPGGWRGIKKHSGGILYDWPAHFVDQALLFGDALVESVYCDIHYNTKWDTDIGNYGNLIIKFENEIRYQIEISNLSMAEKPRWYVVGDEGGLIKYGLDPQEGPMRDGDIDSAEEDPANYAKVWTAAGGEHKELVIESVRGTWKSYYKNIADVLNNGAELVVKPEEMRKVMQVYDAAMESAETGQTIRF